MNTELQFLLYDAPDAKASIQVYVKDETLFATQKAIADLRARLEELGAEITELPEGLIIKGKPEGLRGGGECDAWNDHRIAMAAAIASVICQNPVTVLGAEAVEKSYPNFWRDFAQLTWRLL